MTAQKLTLIAKEFKYSPEIANKLEIYSMSILTDGYFTHNN
ncbi:hypothetical protein B6N60_01102 [Richelia sinica FACHB-800]|uniref:Uncharacterized protein n=1 Tax=Richelia sinica FACHB-800 TaxID=1357546 RepID=A0A975T5I0_9NOST|nr:hypothetical protein B6N60_01102 [Richelia sinica FACHB-800]